MCGTLSNVLSMLTTLNLSFKSLPQQMSIRSGKIERRWLTHRRLGLTSSLLYLLGLASEVRVNKLFALYLGVAAQYPAFASSHLIIQWIHVGTKGFPADMEEIILMLLSPRTSTITGCYGQMNSKDVCGSLLKCYHPLLR